MDETLRLKDRVRKEKLRRWSLEELLGSLTTKDQQLWPWLLMKDEDREAWAGPETAKTAAAKNWGKPTFQPWQKLFIS